MSVGRMALFKDDEIVFKEIVSRGKTYVEIGTLFGGSACLAGKAGCEVFCIDPLDGYYAKKHYQESRVDPPTGLVPTPELVRINWALEGLDPKKLHIFPQAHPPWPEPIEHMKFDIGFIDGDHRLVPAMLDWLGMSPRITKYIMIHDRWKPTVAPIVRTAIRNSAWEPYLPPRGFDTHIQVLKRL